MSDVLILEKHKDLFKNEESVRKFAEILQAAAQHESMQLLLFDEKLLGALVSTMEAKARLSERIAARLIQDPRSLDVLKERLESEDLVPLDSDEPSASAPSGKRAGGRRGRKAPVS